MASSRDRRVAKELQDIQADKDNSGVCAEPVNGSSLKHFKGSITGPPDTPYAGGTFVIQIEIPDNYPFKSPSMRFETKIWHPNVSSQTGAICLDTLGSGWSPVQTIKTALLSIRMLLEVPNPKDPQDAEVASMLLHQPMEFAKVAQQWAIKYAGAEKQELDLRKYEKSPQETLGQMGRNMYKGFHPILFQTFLEMGFDIEDIVKAFEDTGIDRNDGRPYQLDRIYVHNVMAYLCGDS